MAVKCDSKLQMVPVAMKAPLKYFYVKCRRAFGHSGPHRADESDEPFNLTWANNFTMYIYPEENR